MSQKAQKKSKNLNVLKPNKSQICFNIHHLSKPQILQDQKILANFQNFKKDFEIQIFTKSLFFN
jgi:hypothetical protein